MSGTGKERQRESMRRLRAANPERNRKYQREWYAAHPETHRRYHLKKRYGLSLEQFNSLGDAQGWKCAICGREGKLCVDHCHRTGRVRGLLCNPCNRAIGLFQDNPVVMRSAARYVGGVN